MKRFIAVLLVMGVIMTVFAATGTVGSVNITRAATDASSTDVVLNLNQNAGKVWFSAGEYSAVSTYYLSLPAITELNQSPLGNTNWFATGNDLVLNWNIVSCDNVKIELHMGGKLKGTNNSSNEIGWKITYNEKIYSGNELASDNTNTEINLYAGYPTERDNLSAMAMKKKKDIYGSSGSLPITQITTENTYGKKVDVYTATLTAKVIITD